MALPLRFESARSGGLADALALSLATGRSFVLEGGGLGPAELALVRAAQAVCGAEVDLGSELRFEPGPLRAADYLLDAGPGPVATLVRMLAVPLGLAAAPSRLRLRGLTHGVSEPMPCLLRAWLPVVRELGHDLDVEQTLAGWPPEGGGEVSAVVRAARPPVALDRRSRGTLVEARVLSTLSNLPFQALSGQSERALACLKESGIHAEADNLPVRAPRSKGIGCLVLGVFERGIAAFAAFGGSDAMAGALAEEASRGFTAFLRTRGAVEGRLAAELLVPLALAAAGHPVGPGVVSRLTASDVRPELLEAVGCAQRFLDVEAAVLADPRGPEAEIRVAPRKAGLVAALQQRGAVSSP